MSVVTKIFGTKHERDIKKLAPIVERVNEVYPTMRDVDLLKLGEDFRARITDGEELDELLPEVFAAAKEAARRLCGKTWDVADIPQTWEMVHFDVQLIGGIVLHQGKITEMATGEGKTLVATLPLTLAGLTGRGAHLVTVNEYLARRDREWNGPLYESLGVSIGVIQRDMSPPERQEQYACDITYGTNSEFGFDYLRDNMAVRYEDRVQRGHYYAIVDEVDSVLIDEARTPLIISGPVAHDTTGHFAEMRPAVHRLVQAQTEQVNRFVHEAEKALESGDSGNAAELFLLAERGGPKHKRLMKAKQEAIVQKLIQQAELAAMRDKRMHEVDDQLYFAIDEREHSINLTEKGRELLSPKDRELFVMPDVSEQLSELEGREDLSFAEKNEERDRIYRQVTERTEKVSNVHQLLRAYSLYERDVEYVVQDSRVVIVDQFTGRLMPGRRYSEGLHSAIEAKENVTVQGETQTMATVTIQNYFRMYDRLAGMTGTAETEAPEFFETYKLDVVVIPTNEPVRRIDYDDVVFRTRREKYNAIIDEVIKHHKARRPVLVGTVSVEVSETLSRMLKRRGVPHNVLNAKQHQSEAEIVANAGQPGAVTIATNMAGRGTDIKLGPGVVRSGNCPLVEPRLSEDVCPYLQELDCHADVPCGLHIIGTERHEARRIDRQLRGRSGRQGDPGSSRFYLSLEDNLMRLFGSDRMIGIMDKLGVKEGEVIEHGMVTKAIGRAQKRVEAQNFSVRKRLLEYDDVLNQQREVIYDRRLAALEGRDLSEEIRDIIERVSGGIVRQHCSDLDPTNWNVGQMRSDLGRLVLADVFPEASIPPNASVDEVEEKTVKRALEVYTNKEALLGSDEMRDLERIAFLRVIDEHWREHLYEMDHLREGISLRAYGQRDPLLEYKKEAFEAFTSMLDRIDEEVARFVFSMVPRGAMERMRKERQATLAGLSSRHIEAQSLLAAAPTAENPSAPPIAGQKAQPVRRKQRKVGPNEPCPCGSGKKYKKCCGSVV
jgi:preprotein translocase subunit SecA